MSIDIIKTTAKVGMHDEGINLDFTNSSLLTIIGKNGSGKSVFLKALEKEIKNYNINKSSENIEIFKSITEFDLNFLKKYIDEEKSFNETTQEILFSTISELSKEKKVTENKFNKTISKKYLELIVQLLPSWKLSIPTQAFKDIEKILKDTNDFGTFSKWLKKYIGTKKDLEVVRTQFAIFDDQYKKIVDFLSKRIGNVKCSYISAINNSINLSLDSKLKTTYRNGKQYVTAVSFFDSKLLYNMIRNSSISIQKFMSMDWNEIEQLSVDNDFQEKINEWLDTILQQPLKFNVVFKKGTEVNGSNSKVIKVNIIVTDEVTRDKIECEDLSSGTKVLLNVFNNISNIDNQTLVIVDEPETGMHPLMQVQVKQYFENLSEQTKARFILCTHSLFFLPRSINEKSLYVSNRSKTNKVQWSLLEASEFIEKHGIQQELELYEMIKYIPFYEVIEYTKEGKNVIVEGESDVIILSHIAKLFKLDSKKDIMFIKPPVYEKGYKGIMSAYNSLKTKEKNLEIFVSPDNDLGTDKTDPDGKYLKEMQALEDRYVPIGKKGKPIESLFEGNDVDKFSALEQKGEKINKALRLKRITSITHLDKGTQKNFRELFKKYGFNIPENLK